MWPESSCVKAVNLVKKSITVTEIINFSLGIVFYWCTLYIKTSLQHSIKLFFYMKVEIQQSNHDRDHCKSDGPITASPSCVMGW